MGLLGFKYRLRPDELTCRESTQDNVMLVGTLAVIYGLSLVIQPDRIWMYNFYSTAKIIPFSPDSWGYASMLGGLLIFAGMYMGQESLAYYRLHDHSYLELFLCIFVRSRSPPHRRILMVTRDHVCISRHVGGESLCKLPEEKPRCRTVSLNQKLGLRSRLL